MTNLLKPNHKLQSQLSGECIVQNFLGSGGQGEVYQVDVAGHLMAVKWYFAHQATLEQRGIIETLIKKGRPNDKFLWPVDIVSDPDSHSFGYLMPLRDEHFKGIVDLMGSKVDPSFRVLTTLGFELADSFLKLHAGGLCYRDISFGNIFFESENGNVLICDNDNVTLDGAGTGGVYGTPRFMAPEIVKMEAPPNTQTDLFSLAVLMFYIFCIHHPLEGKKEYQIHCLDAPAMTKLYGTEPVFIFDPQNDSNRPVFGIHDTVLAFWKVYPESLRKLFTKAFTLGIIDAKNGRVRESEWRAIMVQLRDSIFYCSKCGFENFYDAEVIKASSGKSSICWKCQSQLQLPMRIRIAKNIVMLNHNTKLFPHHIDDQRTFDFVLPVAEVSQHPQKPDVWGLKNVSDTRWSMTLSDGTIKDVDPQRTAPLAIGVRINFGKFEGEIRI